ncbi:MAG: FkbM family methyltransferase [Sphingobacteriales bacterium]|nr:FkbM family methyltransferase [Sphingobacteriales bacterium]
MFNYLKSSFARKKARRITQEYPPRVESFNLGKYGVIDYAHWTNPLAPKISIVEETVSFFNQFIKEGDLAIDIGANVGDTTVPMALCTGKTGMTIGFDPNPLVFKILQTNASLNKDKYILDAENCAISTIEEEFYFISSEASFANGAISPSKDSEHGKFVQPNKVKGVNLKAFLESKYAHWASKLSFIKIDTEGYDKEIIKSISDLILKYKPVIVAESFGKASDEAKIELYEVIAKNGYEIYYFEDFNVNAEVVKLNTAKDMLNYKHTINVYAKPNT